MAPSDTLISVPTNRSYAESAPPVRLRSQIVCFWHRPANAPASTSRVLPDGCIDVIWAGELPPFVAGPMTVPMLPASAAGAEIIGVRFRPGIAPALLDISASELLDHHVPLRDIWRHDRYQAWANVTAEEALPEKLGAIAEVIEARLVNVRPPDPIVTEAARWIANQPFGSLPDLSRRSGLSERQLRRRFDDAVGYGPKMLQRILRLQRLLWLTSHQANQSLTLSQLAFAAGYADQPHMTREVTALAGTSPRRLLGAETRSAVSDFFKTPPR